MMTALIVDDERLARRELRQLLAEGHPEVTVVGEAANAREAFVQLAQLRPELLFLDIQMPGQSGFELLNALGSEGEPRPPKVIFVTAYDEHALRAFEFHPFDYLLKPVDPVRLADSLAALGASATQSPLAGPAPIEPGPAESAARVLRENDHVLVKEADGGRGFLLRVGDLRLAAAEGNGCRLFLGDGRRAQVPRSLNTLANRLDPALFFQASRQHLVNLGWVKAVEPWFSHGLLLTLRGDGQIKVEVSRRQAQEFRARMAL